MAGTAHNAGIIAYSLATPGAETRAGLKTDF